MNEVLPQLNQLLFSSVEGVLVESVEVIDAVVRARPVRPQSLGAEVRLRGGFLRA
ncbi:hypothetical protein [Actinacidiphila paucisporea]|uniref:hypothetical protein n=1 Tax=Actinacidiphila paucisporea TaxID=310782 RepID=UPI0013565051|nr:hypothetical protein [Actinacidiphila paucisporea]